MRGRDNGLPDYNTVRKCFHLPQIKDDWSIINPELAETKPGIIEKLKNTYGGDPDNIDL